MTVFFLIFWSFINNLVQPNFTVILENRLMSYSFSLCSFLTHLSLQSKRHKRVNEKQWANFEIKQKMNQKEIVWRNGLILTLKEFFDIFNKKEFSILISETAFFLCSHLVSIKQYNYMLNSKVRRDKIYLKQKRRWTLKHGSFLTIKDCKFSKISTVLVDRSNWTIETVFY